MVAVDSRACQACRDRAGRVVLDLGDQPACDYFPAIDDPGPDPVYPLLCSSCGLAQLRADPTVPEEPKGTEPAALVAHAADAVEKMNQAGLLPEHGLVAEYGSPYGGSWLALLAARGLEPSGRGGQADVVLDCFGLMHASDQAAALAERAARVASGGVLLLPAIVDASPAKQALRMPDGYSVTGTGELARLRPDALLLFVPDLLAEVGDAFPEVEAAGGRWVDA